MFLLMFAAILGGVATIVLLWPMGEWIALLWAPLGGSISAIGAATYLLAQPVESEQDTKNAPKRDRNPAPARAETPLTEGE
ncbi:hypothetical protein [Methylobacterium oxalidis]|uniref:Uncharacterized protein n=1 Tax=Methylobacterium oxalidis TaxID=944322 RepID=A0A512J6X4_9HYPH|nr:hypothetical protein [Methylobacterium oxalidis]GEP05609.1 hypothetical protein MOX02_36470 [Methylobacterium oxalidis]GJE35501.1 hypothetical protein LDDCCGHA_5719 [Methylobacterium oxalidis]GLS65411.1 hypothetical protein GCM10007888_37930 [Methylobacterium oxalidis]